MRLIKYAGRILFSFLLIVILSLLIYFNTSLYYKPLFIKEGKEEINNDLLSQLHFLKSEIHNGTAEEMQTYYPEGFVFMYAIYGLTWVEFSESVHENSSLYTEADAEISRSYYEINSEKAKNIFDSSLKLPYGSFYAGWSNYFLGKKLSIKNPDNRDSSELKEFQLNCEKIENAIKQTIYPPSYENASWPADVFVCMASLALHDKICKPKYQSTIHVWLQKVKMHLDLNGLIPHSARENGSRLNPQEAPLKV